jgi:hypothetical protein
MKKILLTLGILIAAYTQMTAQTVNDLFKEFKNRQHVECVEVSPAMMGLVKMKSKKEEGGDFIKKISSIKILSIEDDSDLCMEFRNKASKLQKNGYETLVNSNEDNEKTLILAKTKEDYITEMVILNLEPKECALVQIKGKLKSSDIEACENLNF